MAEPAIEFSLDFTYADKKAPALQGVSGTVAPGQCIVLCGSSGCGKTTLLRCFNHLIPQFYEGKLRGFCRMAGQDLESLSMGQTGRLAASVFQDPRSQFFTMNTETEVAFGLENFGCTRAHMQSRTDLAFDTFRMDKLRNRNVFALSSGERQLTAILSAWAMDTDVLLLDEPTANLDYSAIRQLRQALLELKARGKTLVISEHRLCYLKGIADEYWRMEDGEIRDRFPACRLESLSFQELLDLGLRTTDLDLVTSRIQPAPEPERQDVLSIRDLCFRYGKKGPQVLNHLSLEAETGQVIGLIGANGCGKTTLGKLAAGLLAPTSGTIALNGKALKTKALSDESIFIMQEAEFQFFTNSVLQELRYGLDKPEEKEGEIQALLKCTGLWQCRSRHPFSLSGGQMQKLVMLLACLSSKPIVVLDEPTAGLDAGSLQVCADLIRRMQKDRIVLLISHDLELLSLVANRCLLVSGGSVEREFSLITVEYYGSETPLNGVATIGSPDARTLVISPWDTKLLKDIQKAIQMSDLGINPQNDGKVIRLQFPQLTEERRKELTKQVKKYAEDAKVALRNVRREGMDYVKKLKKANEITEDEQKKAEKDLQDLLDKYIKKVDAANEAKDKELLSI